MTGQPTTPVPHVRVLWRPEQFNRVTNGTFETNTTGWVATAGINAAGTSITRVTTDAHSGSACASVVCTSTDTSGVNFDFGSNRFYDESSYGAMYAAVVWMKRVSGSRRARITLGSLGTSSDRATLTITDLTDQWQPYVVRWLPTGNRTDVELAVTNGSAEAVTFRIDDVAVYLVDAFSQVENGTFETDTTGWSAYLSGSIAQSTAESFGGSACARITSGATAFGGVTYSLSGRTFVSGRTYRVRVAVKTISGSGQWYLELSDGTTASDTFFTPDGTFTVQTADLTPAADRTSLNVYIGHVPASSAVMAIDEVELYELVDELGTDVGDMTWSRSPDAIGTITVDVENADGRYDPRYASSVIYGSVAPGKRIHGRASYSGALYPLFFGTLTTIEAADRGGIHATLLAEDMMGDIARAQHASQFYPDVTYADARKRAIGAMLRRNPRGTSTAYGSSRMNVTTAGLENSCFYAGTDDLVSVASYLGDLNEATQSVHFVKPSPHANIGWKYTTVDRITLTDDSSDYTIDEDFEDFGGVRSTHEALENQQVVPWQGFEQGPLPNDHFWIDGLDTVAQAYERAGFDGSGYLQDEDPYLHFTREEYGDNADVPEPTYREKRYWGWRWGKNGRRKGRKLRTRKRRIYPDPFVPFTILAGQSKVITVDLAVPMDDLRAAFSVTAPGDGTIRYIEQSPQRMTFEISAPVDSVFTAVSVTGMPYTPLDEFEAQVTTGTDALEGQYAGPTFSTPFIPSAGAAEGVARYRNWRYGAPLLRPRLTDHNTFTRTLTADVTDHLTVSADDWNIDALLFVVTGSRWEVAAGALEWRAFHDLEELRTHTDWFTLGTSSLGGSDILAP